MLIWTLTGLLIAYAAQFLCFFPVAAIPVPYGDTLVISWRYFSTDLLRFLWGQHGDHRSPFVSLLFAWDLGWWGGSRYFLPVLNLGALTVVLTFLWDIFRRVSSPVVRSGFAIAVIGSCSAAMYVVWIYPINAGFAWLSLLIIAMVWAMFRSRPGRVDRFFFFALGLQILLFMTQITGFVWYLFVVPYWLWRREPDQPRGPSFRKAVLWLACLLPLVALYFFTWTPSTRIGRPTDPLAFLEFFWGLLSMPFSRSPTFHGGWPRHIPALLLGLIQLTLAIWILIRSWTRRHFLEPIQFLGALLVLFSLLSLAIVAWVRVGPVENLSFRYLAYILLLDLGAMFYFARPLGTRVKGYVWVLILSLACLGQFPIAQYAAHRARDFKTAMDRVEGARGNPAAISAADRQMIYFPSAETLVMTVDFLKARGTYHWHR